jgi:IS5 family transposase
MLTIQDFIVVVYCLIDDVVTALQIRYPFRTRGFAPALRDSEVITMVVVGEFLGIDTDEQIWEYFCRHWRLWFPKLGSRSQFVRQAANLWHVIQLVHHGLATALGAWDDDIHIVDGVPMPICELTRAARCRRFRGIAATSYCAAKDRYYFGLKGHVLITAEGVITAITVTPANTDEREAAWDLVDGIMGLLLGDKGYISKFFRACLRTCEIQLETPLRRNMHDPRPSDQVGALMTVRRRIETVIGQLTERLHLATVRARDVLHLTGRIARKILAHTLGVLVNRQLGQEPLQFDAILAA